MCRIKDGSKYFEKLHQEARVKANEYLRQHGGERHEGVILENAMFLGLIAKDLHKSTTQGLIVAVSSFVLSLIAIAVAIIK